jgi:hypothetical protein
MASARWSRENSIVAVALLVAAGLGCESASSGPDGAPTNGPDGGPDGGPETGDPPVCDGQGAPAVPAGFPALGARCPAHFTYHLETSSPSTSSDGDDIADRGARPMTEPEFAGYHDLGYSFGTSTGDYTVALFLPSLAPGVYRGPDGAQVKRSVAALYDTALASIPGFSNGEALPSRNGVLVEIAGNAGGAIWGRFLAVACVSDLDDCIHFERGRFSARIEAAASAGEFGGASSRAVNAWAAPAYVCEALDDCPPATAACVREWRCEGGDSASPGRCGYEEVDLFCGDQERCDIRLGCVHL